MSFLDFPWSFAINFQIIFHFFEKIVFLGLQVLIPQDCRFHQINFTHFLNNLIPNFYSKIFCLLALYIRLVFYLIFFVFHYFLRRLNENWNCLFPAKISLSDEMMHYECLNYFCWLTKEVQLNCPQWKLISRKLQDFNLKIIHFKQHLRMVSDKVILLLKWNYEFNSSQFTKLYLKTLNFI